MYVLSVFFISKKNKHAFHLTSTVCDNSMQ